MTMSDTTKFAKQMGLYAGFVVAVCAAWVFMSEGLVELDK